MKWSFAVLFALAMPSAYAEPWLCTDADGNKSYSYEPESAKKKNCVDKPIPSTNVVRKGPRRIDAEAGSEKFPAVDARTQKNRDAERRRILERELAEEKKALADAMKQLEAQAKAAAVEKTQARFEERLKPYQDKVRLHLTNIATLERELGSKS
jgi:hypothetical protein